MWQDILGTLPPGGEPAHYRDLGNSPFTSKRQAYQASEFAMTRQLAAENAEWNAERIAARQQHMARLATAIWRIDQLS
ncbi:MAG: HNH endonuclease family protein [Candidatus Tectimicrobiota bacterium]